MGIQDWSLTPASNGNVDSFVNYREGQAPSSLNNAGRGVMARIKGWWLDSGGMLDTAGSGTAYTLTTNLDLDTLTDGACVACRLHATSGEAPTLAVDGTDAKAITVRAGVAPDAGMLLLGSIQRFTYDAGDDEWRLNAVQTAPGTAQTGDLKLKATSISDAGWVKADGRTIGNPSSNATSRANDDVSALFHQLWADYSNTLLPIQDSAGSATTRGASAADDFAANKRLPVPDISGRMFAGLDNLSGTSRNVVASAQADVLGGTTGAETVTLSQSNLPSLTWPSTLAISGSQAGGVTRNLGSAERISPTGAGQAVAAPLSFNETTLGISGSVSSGGSGTAVNKMPPTFFGYVFIKL